MVDVAQLKTTQLAANDEIPAGEYAGKPAIPASTVVATNDSDYLMWVEIVGGTVTVVAVDGVTTGRTSGMFLLRPGVGIAITYSVVPTAWHWFPVA
jgi:hypothetical protein